jgi:hypothetical protein
MLISYSSPQRGRPGALQAMDPRKYEYQGDFARRYVAEDEAIGEASGRAALVVTAQTLDEALGLR